MPSLVLQGTAGALEAFLDAPAQSPIAAALLCHPHPPSGGTMHTHAVYRAMRALRDLGCAVLRFNFRGVGRSEGKIGDGDGELADGHTAFEALARLQPGLPLLSGGMSFGAYVGMTVGVDLGAAGLLGLGAPYSKYDFSTVTRSARPKAFVLAEHDQFTSVTAMHSLIAEMQKPTRLAIVNGTSHLFTENLDAYEQQVSSAGLWLLQQAGI